MFALNMQIVKEKITKEKPVDIFDVVWKYIIKCNQTRVINKWMNGWTDKKGQKELDLVLSLDDLFLISLKKQKVNYHSELGDRQRNNETIWTIRNNIPKEGKLISQVQDKCQLFTNRNNKKS